MSLVLALRYAPPAHSLRRDLDARRLYPRTARCVLRRSRDTCHGSKTLCPSAPGSDSPTSAASVGATSRMSMRPSDFPARTPGPTTRNAARRSGSSGTPPCVPPGLTVDITGPSSADPVRHPGLSPTNRRSCGIFAPCASAEEREHRERASRPELGDAHRELRGVGFPASRFWDGVQRCPKRHSVCRGGRHANPRSRDVPIRVGKRSRTVPGAAVRSDRGRTHVDRGSTRARGRRRQLDAVRAVRRAAGERRRELDGGVGRDLRSRLRCPPTSCMGATSRWWRCRAS